MYFLSNNFKKKKFIILRLNLKNGPSKNNPNILYFLSYIIWERKYIRLGLNQI